MKTIIQEHCFDDPRFKSCAKHARKSKLYIDDVMHEYTVYFAAIRMWRHSQQHGLIDATGYQIDEWADIEGVHLSFAAGRLITLIVKKEDSVSSIYRIHGNEESITKLLSLRGTRSESGKLGALVRWGDKEEKSGIKSENGMLGAEARWDNANKNGKTQKNAKTNGKQMANAIEKMASAIEKMASAKETMANANEKMANDGKQSKKVSKDRILYSYSSESGSDPVPDPVSPQNFSPIDFSGGGAAVTPLHSSSSPNVHLLPAQARLSAKTRKPARDRASSPERERVWNFYAEKRREAYRSNLPCIKNQHTERKLEEMIAAIGVEKALAVVEKYIDTPKKSYIIESHPPRYLFEDYADILDKMTVDETIGNTGEERAELVIARKRNSRQA